MSRKTLRILLLAAIKLAVSGLLIWYVTTKIDIGSALVHLKNLSGITAIAVVAMIISGFAIAGYRLRPILGMFGEKCSFLTGFQTMWIGNFFGQALVTFLTGDAVRIWWIMRLGIGLRVAASAILLDRAIGFIALMVLVLLALTPLLDLTGDAVMRAGLFTIALTGTGAIVVFFVLGRMVPEHMHQGRYIGFLADIASASRHALAAPREGVFAFVLSVGVQFIMVLAIFILARAFGLGVEYYQCLIVVPVVSLISMIPIFVAGWGAREFLMVQAFGLMGFAADKVLAVSITFGLAMMIASVPGGVLWLIKRRAKDKYGGAARRRLRLRPECRGSVHYGARHIYPCPRIRSRGRILPMPDRGPRREPDFHDTDFRRRLGCPRVLDGAGLRSHGLRRRQGAGRLHHLRPGDDDRVRPWRRAVADQTARQGRNDRLRSNRRHRIVL